MLKAWIWSWKNNTKNKIKWKPPLSTHLNPIPVLTEEEKKTIWGKRIAEHEAVTNYYLWQKWEGLEKKTLKLVQSPSSGNPTHQASKRTPIPIPWSTPHNSSHASGNRREKKRCQKKWEIRNGGKGFLQIFLTVIVVDLFSCKWDIEHVVAEVRGSPWSFRVMVRRWGWVWKAKRRYAMYRKSL